MTSEISNEISQKASLILAEIKQAASILLHCHPSPDPDSVGSALAMKFALEQLGKKVTVIRGDSVIPEAFMHFPGTGEIVQKNFFEVDLKEFDLFIAQDSGSTQMISRKAPVVFPNSLKVIVIDHHETNIGYGSINLIDTSYPATCQMLFDIFSVWNIELTPDIAKNIFIGMYTDTGGFKYEGTSAHTFEVAARLKRIVPDISGIITTMENSNTPGFLAFEGLALNSIQEFYGGRFAIALVSYEMLQDKKIPLTDIATGFISSVMRSVKNWDITAALIETASGTVKVSFRSHDSDIWDVSKLAVALGGGGHKAAAAASIQGSFDEVKQRVVSKAKELYNL